MENKLAWEREFTIRYWVAAARLRRAAELEILNAKSQTETEVQVEAEVEAEKEPKLSRLISFLSRRLSGKYIKARI